MHEGQQHHSRIPGGGQLLISAAQPAAPRVVCSGHWRSPVVLRPARSTRKRPPSIAAARSPAMSGTLQRNQPAGCGRTDSPIAAGPTIGLAAPLAGGEAPSEAEDGEVASSDHHQRRIGPFFSPPSLSAPQSRGAGGPGLQQQPSPRGGGSRRPRPSLKFRWLLLAGPGS